MSIRGGAAFIACLAALGPMAIPGLADPSVSPDQALQDLRAMIAPSPEAERDYAIALEIWKREAPAPRSHQGDMPGTR
jgi:hypothetical protein